MMRCTVAGSCPFTSAQVEMWCLCRPESLMSEKYDSPDQWLAPSGLARLCGVVLPCFCCGIKCPANLVKWHISMSVMICVSLRRPDFISVVILLLEHRVVYNCLILRPSCSEKRSVPAFPSQSRLLTFDFWTRKTDFKPPTRFRLRSLLTITTNLVGIWLWDHDVFP